MRLTVSFKWSTFLAACLFSTMAGKSDAQNLRVVSYNLSGSPTNSSEQAALQNILEAIGNKSVFGNSTRVDLMAFQEGPLSNENLELIETAFENVFGGNYEVIASTVDSNQTRTGFVYNSDLLTVNQSFETTFGFEHHQFMAQFSYAGVGADNQFWIYSLHFVEGDSSSDFSERFSEAFNVAQYYNSLGLFGKNYIYAGTTALENNFEDANLYIFGFDEYDSESLQESSGIEAVWSGSNAFVPFHTTEPTGLSGGMSKRLDTFSVCRWLIDDEGMEFVPGSTTILGNNGSHLLENGIVSGNADVTVQTDLAALSDHLPVFTDYRFNVVDQPVNDFYVGFATDSFIVQPAGPRSDAAASWYFNIEGDANGEFASFGVLDFDLTDELTDKETIFHSEKLEIVLSQANASFTQNGAYRIYLCTPQATAVPIDNNIQYQAGNNGIDCVPTVLSNGAISLRTYPGIHLYPSGGVVPYGSGIGIRLFGPDIDPAFVDKVQNNGKLRLLFVPVTDTCAATFAGVGHPGSATPPRYFVTSDIETVFNPSLLTFESGFLSNGDKTRLAESDNSKITVRTNSTIEMVFEGVTRSYPTQKFEFTFESSVRSARPVSQKIELYNFENEEWVVVDERIANVLGDRSVTVQPEEPLWHYRMPGGNNLVRARATFSRLGLARGITAFIDHVEWRIR